MAAAKGSVSRRIGRHSRTSSVGRIGIWPRTSRKPTTITGMLATMGTAKNGSSDAPTITSAMRPATVMTWRSSSSPATVPARSLEISGTVKLPPASRSTTPTAPTAVPTTSVEP